MTAPDRLRITHDFIEDNFLEVWSVERESDDYPKKPHEWLAMFPTEQEAVDYLAWLRRGKA